MAWVLFYTLGAGGAYRFLFYNLGEGGVYLIVSYHLSVGGGYLFFSYYALGPGVREGPPTRDA